MQTKCNECGETNPDTHHWMYCRKGKYRYKDKKTGEIHNCTCHGLQ